jgi:hypothetical protein
MLVKAQSLRSHSLYLFVKGIHFLFEPRVIRMPLIAAPAFPGLSQRRVWWFPPWDSELTFCGLKRRLTAAYGGRGRKI